MQKKIKKGMSLVEVMMVIAIIGILSSIVIVSMSSVRQNTRDKAVYMQALSTQPLAYKCIRSSSSATITSPTAGGQICNSNGYSTWPILTPGSSWTYSGWCTIDSAGTSCSPVSANCGYNATTGKFCYRLVNGSKSIWCTQDKCGKSF